MSGPSQELQNDIYAPGSLWPIPRGMGKDSELNLDLLYFEFSLQCSFLAAQLSLRYIYIYIYIYDTNGSSAAEIRI